MTYEDELCRNAEIRGQALGLLAHATPDGFSDLDTLPDEEESTDDTADLRPR